MSNKPECAAEDPHAMTNNPINTSPEAVAQVSAGLRVTRDSIHFDCGGDCDGERRYAADLLDAVSAKLAQAEKERDEADKNAEAMEAKWRALAPHGTCACSMDSPDDVCLHHSPKLASAIAQRDSALAALAEARRENAFQAGVAEWMQACFGPVISADKIERNHRFIEEALELVQACGCTQSEVHQLVDYVYGRPPGEINQEVGGVMVTLAALCLANGFDMASAGRTELARVWTKIEIIRAKQAAKPKHSPLPSPPPAD